MTGRWVQRQHCQGQEREVSTEQGWRSRSALESGDRRTDEAGEGQGVRSACCVGEQVSLETLGGVRCGAESCSGEGRQGGGDRRLLQDSWLNPGSGTGEGEMGGFKARESLLKVTGDSVLSGLRRSYSRRREAGWLTPCSLRVHASRGGLRALTRVPGSAPSGRIDVSFRKQGRFSGFLLGHLLLTVMCKLPAQNIPIFLFAQAHCVLWSKGPVSQYR